jgi:hypothetical protein
MGQSTNGMLAYGYDLGGEEGWKLEGLGEYDELPELDWYSPEDEEGDGFQEAAERRLLAELAGFTETWSSGSEGYFEREREAKARIGVKFGTHCSGDYPMFLLAAKVITVHRGSVKDIDMAALAVEPEMNGWDEKLRRAVEALGIAPARTSRNGCSAPTGDDRPAPRACTDGRCRPSRMPALLVAAAGRLDVNRSREVIQCRAVEARSGRRRNGAGCGPTRSRSRASGPEPANAPTARRPTTAPFPRAGASDAASSRASPRPPSSRRRCPSAGGRSDPRSRDRCRHSARTAHRAAPPGHALAGDRRRQRRGRA